MEIKEGFVICTEAEKKHLIETSDGFKNYIFLSYPELIKKVYGEVDKKAVFALMEEYSFSQALAKEYMKYVPFAEEKSYNNVKLDQLVSVRSFLLKKGLFHKDDFFLYRLPQFPLTFLDYEETKQYESLKGLLQNYTEVTEVPKNCGDFHPEIHEFKTFDDEVTGVMNEIAKLHKNSVSLSSIHVFNMTEDYESEFRRASRDYGIPFSFRKKKNILHTSFAHKLMELLETEESFDAVLDKLPDSEFTGSFIQLVSHYGIRDKKPSAYKEFIRDELKNVSYPAEIYPDMVDVSDSLDVRDGEYGFFLGFNQGVAPRIYKDEAYLNDSELELIGLPTSVDKNRESRRELVRLLKSSENLYVSYNRRFGTKNMMVSSLASELGLSVKEENPEYGYGALTDKLRLTRAVSVYEKTHEKSKDLDQYDVSGFGYKEYDHSFRGIAPDAMAKRVSAEKPLSVAYSSIKNYFECPFKYYVARVLNLDPYEDSTATRLGTYSHAVLEDSYAEDFDFEESVLKHKTEGLEKLNPEEFARDEFYFDQMKQVLSDLIQFNRDHESRSVLVNVKREAHVEFIEGTLRFHGYVDKLLYTEEGDDVYAAIIDYKTGKDKPDLINVENGFHLQLPSYMYLLSKYEPFRGKKVHIIGIYLQKVNMIALDSTKDVVTQREKAFRLQGYSIADGALLSKLDPGYDRSDYIASMMTVKGGGFGAYAKTMTKEQEEELIQMVDHLIHKTHDDIMEGKFEIAPKKIDGNDESCTFCKFRDICFKDYRDYVYLEKKVFPPKEEK